MKKRIAIWLPGGVGGGYYDQGIPVIARLIDDLAGEYTITIYSLHCANGGFTPKGYAFFSIHRSVKFPWTRWLLLCGLFLWHHTGKRYDAVYACWGYPAGLIAVALAKLTRRPSVVHLQGGDAVYIPALRYGSFKGIRKKLMTWAYNHCTVLIALTAFQESKLREAGITRHIDVIPFGPDTRLFRRGAKSHPASITRFLHVGNLLPVKDQMTLLNAFARIATSRAAVLRIIGEDHLRGAIQEHCRNLGLTAKVAFLQIQPYESMPSHYAWADVLLMTSVYEGQCMAVSEAAASGVLVAGTRVGLLSDWGEDHGIVADVADARQLADRVLLAMDTPALTTSQVEKAAMTVSVRDSKWTSRTIIERIDLALQQTNIKKVAVIGGGAHTIPTYRAMLKQLAARYSLTLFSEFHLGEEWRTDAYALYYPSQAKRPRRWRDVLLLLTVVKHSLTNRPDVIHAHSTYPSGAVAVIAGALFRIPVVVCLDAAEGSAVPGIGFGDLLYARRKKLNAWVLKRASAITSLTRFQRDQVRDNLSVWRTIHVIPRGVDLRKWTPRHAMPGQTLHLLSVAYLHPVKDHGTMLRAFQLIARQLDTKLTLVGKDYDNGNVQKLAAALGIADRVHFEGFVPHDMITSFYGTAHILLHTSLFESQAMAVVEAMATGVLVCGTHVGIMADLAGECCVTVSPGDHVRLAEKVVQLVGDAVEQGRLRTNARRWVETHDLGWTVRQYEGLYGGLVR